MPWVGEWCAKGWGVEYYSRGNKGGGLGPQEKQGTTVGEGDEEEETAIGIFLCTHACSRLSEGGVPRVQAMGGEKPLAWAMGDWAILVQATSGWEPLVWANGSGGLNAMWCLLHDLQVAGTDHGGHLRGQREVWPATTGGLRMGSTGGPSHFMGQRKRGHCNQAPHVIILTPWEHTHPAAATAKRSGQLPGA